MEQTKMQKNKFLFCLIIFINYVADDADYLVFVFVRSFIKQK